ncbi:MAG: DUF3592 domain-containing protein [Planctomycetes bacterium]|nr:DUF3592 domain-containing protein [Planctomycetota bacterium]
MIVLELIGRFAVGFGKALAHPACIFVLLWCAFSAGGSWVMLSDSDVPYIGAFQGAIATAPGEVIEVGPMPFHDRGDESGSQPLRAVSFKFTLNGKHFLGTSYTGAIDYRPGQAVTIEYEPDDPHTARVLGTQLMPNDDVLWFILIFPAIGALMVVVWLCAAMMKGFVAAGEALRRA